MYLNIDELSGAVQEFGTTISNLSSNLNNSGFSNRYAEFFQTKIHNMQLIEARAFAALNIPYDFNNPAASCKILSDRLNKFYEDTKDLNMVSFDLNKVIQQWKVTHSLYGIDINELSHFLADTFTQEFSSSQDFLNSFNQYANNIFNDSDNASIVMDLFTGYSKISNVFSTRMLDDNWAGHVTVELAQSMIKKATPAFIKRLSALYKIKNPNIKTNISQNGSNVQANFIVELNDILTDNIGNFLKADDLKRIQKNNPSAYNDLINSLEELLKSQYPVVSAEISEVLRSSSGKYNSEHLLFAGQNSYNVFRGFLGEVRALHFIKIVIGENNSNAVVFWQGGIPELETGAKPHADLVLRFVANNKAGIQVKNSMQEMISFQSFSKSDVFNSLLNNELNNMLGGNFQIISNSDMDTIHDIIETSEFNVSYTKVSSNPHQFAEGNNNNIVFRDLRQKLDSYYEQLQKILSIICDSVMYLQNALPQEGNFMFISGANTLEIGSVLLKNIMNGYTNGNGSQYFKMSVREYNIVDYLNNSKNPFNGTGTLKSNKGFRSYAKI